MTTNWFWPHSRHYAERRYPHYSLRAFAAPALEPLTLGEVKDHCKVDPDITEDDDLLEVIIAGARQLAEAQLRRCLITQTWDVLLDSFCDPIEIPLSPVQSITSVSYYDTDNALQVVSASDYEADIAAIRPVIRSAWNVLWPQTYLRLDAVTVRVVAGFGSARTDVPAAIRLWMKAAAATMYQDRTISRLDAKLVYVNNPFIDGLLDPYRIIEL